MLKTLRYSCQKDHIWGMPLEVTFETRKLKTTRKAPLPRRKVLALNQRLLKMVQWQTFRWYAIFLELAGGLCHILKVEDEHYNHAVFILNWCQQKATWKLLSCNDRDRLNNAGKTRVSSAPGAGVDLVMWLPCSVCISLLLLGLYKYITVKLYIHV